MRRWRFIVAIFAVVLILSGFNVLGFHEASPVYTAVLIVGMAIITCICDAVDALANRR